MGKVSEIPNFSWSWDDCLVHVKNLNVYNELNAKQREMKEELVRLKVKSNEMVKEISALSDKNEKKFIALQNAIIDISKNLKASLNKSWAEVAGLCRVFVDTVKDAAVFSPTTSSVDALVVAAILAASAIVDTVGSVSVISTVAIAHAICRWIPHTLTQAVVPLAETRRSTISSTDLRVGIYGPGKRDKEMFHPSCRAYGPVFPHARKASLKR
ncbi:hypothetical protein HELRODRAFT_182605 [Helobdella robusta]|uniref:Uncharacterized protein n=1 Tax=Helobdella robusta TaxID=6412 RepID=T1FIG6_HELRO|nr:hypothetical protein HELRODRAFT_182605 [Helobdella robusta]ESN90778.1 hypothetical protein HELRODRAFT_182605 [Helobdella robusta]